MRKLSDDHFAALDYPMMASDKFEKDCFEYESLCSRAYDYVDATFKYFIWYVKSPLARELALETVLFLDRLFLQVLLCLREIYEMRGSMIRDEQCDTFEQLFFQVDEEVRTVKRFVCNGNKILSEATADIGVSLLRKPLLDKFEEIGEWLHTATKDPQLAQMADVMGDKHKMRYTGGLFEKRGNTFADHARMVMDALMLLALPPTTSKKDYGKLYDTTLERFCAGKTWNREKTEWLAVIQNEFENQKLASPSEQADFLKDTRNYIYMQMSLFLKGYGIDHLMAGKPLMGRRLYEQLNGIQRTAGSKTERMKDSGLRVFLSFQAQIAHLDNWTKELEAQQSLPEKPRRGKKLDLFDPKVPEKKLADCFYHVHQDFFGQKPVDRLSANCDLPLFAAYLFVLTEYYGLGSASFSTKGAGHFYEFLKDEAQFPFKVGEKTMRNRLRDMEGFRKKLRKLREASPEDQPKLFEQLNADFHSKDYVRIRDSFRGKPFFKSIRH